MVKRHVLSSPSGPPTVKRRPLDGLAASFARHQRAENRTESTVTTYRKAIDQLGAYLVAHDGPADPARIRREDVESFLVDRRAAGV